ncbi:MAG: hypothetical protein U9R19_02680 [Bacteroidota bacterium]|nr:hypothetical protein [Bacteroidota bacterium]
MLICDRRIRNRVNSLKGQDPVARQSNLIVETTTNYSEDDLRAMLIAEAKKEQILTTEKLPVVSNPVK